MDNVFLGEACTDTMLDGESIYSLILGKDKN